MNYYCTLFNSVYLSRGVAMHASLQQVCPAFHLYIFAFDNASCEVLKKLNLEHTTVISLQEFEDEELLRVKKERTAGEYCWTCTPATILYCIERYNLSHCTYIDADLLFFKDPTVLLHELGSGSVMITDHRYTPEYDASEKYGRYCVQFITFRNDDNGMRVLRWWRDACIDWCYARAEDGKFGDQKYLDNWTRDFAGVHELQHLGGGVALWNIQQYSISCENGKYTGTEKSSGKKFDIIFYHYHQMKYVEGNGFYLGNYRFNESDVMRLYAPYVKALRQADSKAAAVAPGQVFHETEEVPRLKNSLRRKFLYYVKGKFRNYYREKFILKHGACN